MASIDMVCVGVVTGGNRGLGFAVVEQLAATPGVCVVLTARRLQAASNAAQRIRKWAPGANVIPQELDITSDESVANFSRWVRDEFTGGLDFVVNNAGFAYPGASEDIPFSTQAADTLTPNYFGTIRVTRALLPHVRALGRIVNVASSAGLMALLGLSPALQQRACSAQVEADVTNLMEDFLTATRRGDHTAAGFPSTAYGMSKLGIMLLSRVLAEAGIHACSMCPGWCLTDMSASVAKHNDTKLARTAAEGAQDIVFLALPAELGGDPRGDKLDGKFVRPMQPYMVNLIPAGTTSPWAEHELFFHGQRWPYAAASRRAVCALILDPR